MVGSSKIELFRRAPPMFVVFDTVNIYYIPQFLPVAKVLKDRGHQVTLVCYKNKNEIDNFENVLSHLDIQTIWVNGDKEAAKLYAELKPDWIVFGKAFNYLEQLDKRTKSVQLGHGIGPKPSYYHKSSTPMTVRFIEGKLRLEKIQQLYPKDNFVQAGFSKLDPLFNKQEAGLNFRELGLNNDKQTILYAPTFNPSSLECFPDDWPDAFPQYNILIKPHTFTFTREQYKNQRKKLRKWSKFDNTYVASEQDISLLPFVKNADILLSEASSTLFEFAALNKPVIVCNFFKLKWSYRGPFQYRFNRRFGKDNVLYNDIGLHVKSYLELLQAIPQQLNNTKEYEQRRTKYTEDHVGSVDGLASSRIVDYLEKY